MTNDKGDKRNIEPGTIKVTYVEDGETVVREHDSFVAYLNHENTGHTVMCNICGQDLLCFLDMTLTNIREKFLELDNGLGLCLLGQLLSDHIRETRQVVLDKLPPEVREAAEIGDQTSALKKAVLHALSRGNVPIDDEGDDQNTH